MRMASCWGPDDTPMNLDAEGLHAGLRRHVWRLRVEEDLPPVLALAERDVERPWLRGLVAELLEDLVRVLLVRALDDDAQLALDLPGPPGMDLEGEARADGGRDVEGHLLLRGVARRADLERERRGSRVLLDVEDLDLQRVLARLELAQAGVPAHRGAVRRRRILARIEGADLGLLAAGDHEQVDARDALPAGVVPGDLDVQRCVGRLDHERR